MEEKEIELYKGYMKDFKTYSVWLQDIAIYADAIVIKMNGKEQSIIRSRISDILYRTNCRDEKEYQSKKEHMKSRAKGAITTEIVSDKDSADKAFITIRPTEKERKIGKITLEQTVFC